MKCGVWQIITIICVTKAQNDPNSNYAVIDKIPIFLKELAPNLTYSQKL